MPDVREVYEMITKQKPPEPGALERQQKRQVRTARNRKFGALAAAAVIGLAAVVVIVTNRPGTNTTTPGGDPSPRPVPEFSVASFVDLRTGDVTPLPESIRPPVTEPYSGFYSTSPDGTMFAYSACCGPSPVFVANVDGTGIREITPDGVDGFGPSWSPDGSMLVYQQRDGATLEIGNLFVVDVNTGETTQITDLGAAAFGWWFLAPSFSPDGATILFHRPRGPGDNDVSTRWDLWSVPAAGGEPTLAVRDASLGAYGPDEQSLAYVESPRGIWWASTRLMVADADGGDPELLVEGQDEIDFPRWSPDGTRIAYVDAGRIHVVDVATGETSSVADGPDDDLLYTVDWFDEDTLVVVP